MKIFHWAQNDTELLRGTDDHTIPQIKQVIVRRFCPPEISIKVSIKVDDEYEISECSKQTHTVYRDEEINDRGKGKQPITPLPLPRLVLLVFCFFLGLVENLGSNLVQIALTVFSNPASTVI